MLVQCQSHHINLRLLSIILRQLRSVDPIKTDDNIFWSLFNNRVHHDAITILDRHNLPLKRLISMLSGRRLRSAPDQEQKKD